MIEVTTTFSSRLDEALAIRQLKPVDLSKRTGISESTISQYRSGYAKPKQDKLSLISDALNVSPAWLMGLNVPMSINNVDLVITAEDSGIQFVIENMKRDSSFYDKILSYAKYIAEERK